MKSNMAMKVLTIGWLFVAGLMSAASATGQAESATETEVQAVEQTGFESPEMAFAAGQSAFNERDWEAFVDCVSPGRRDLMVGEMAVALAGMSQQPGSDPRVAALVEEYLPRGFDPMDIMLSEDAEAQTVKLAKRMGDPEAFFVEAMSLIFQMQYGQTELAPPAPAPGSETTPGSETAPGSDSGDPDGSAPPEVTDPAADPTKPQALDAEVTTMSDLQVEGDTAEARVTITTSTGDQQARWAFERFEDAWYLSLR